MASRTKNATRNIIFGILLKIYQIIIPFIMRTAMIYFMGVQYLGLNGLFGSVLQVLNLAELGVGSAMVYSMYKPIVENDSIRICALMRLYQNYYRVIGLVVAGLGLLLFPFIPRLIHSDLPPDVNVYVLYLLYLTATVFSYWMFAYKSSLIQAHQRNDIISKVTIALSSFQYISQLIVLVFLKNYYLFVVVVLVTQILTNVVTAIIASRLYPDYKPIGELPPKEKRQINQRIKDLFTAKVGAVVVNSADTIVISAFLGLRILSIYQNYFFILSAVIGVVEVAFSACAAGIGNSIIVESKDKNYKDLRKFTLIIAWIAGFCATCFLCLFQPFMILWVGEELLLEMPAVICLCIYFFVYEMNRVLNTYKDSGGIWHVDRFRALVTALANLCMNLIMVQYWGIYGVLLSTVISMLFIGMPWLLHNLFTMLFEKNYARGYILQLIYYSIITLIVAAATYFACTLIHVGNTITFVLRVAICVVIPNSLFLIIYRQMPDFKDAVLLVNHVTKGKLKLTRFTGERG